MFYTILKTVDNVEDIKKDKNARCKLNQFLLERRFMFGWNHQKRPVKLGLYPLEKFKGDSSIVAEEAAQARTAPKAMPTEPIRYLVAATNSHIDAYEALREPNPFSIITQVPDDLARRTEDIKGFGYFLDASQIGICEIVDSIWLAGAIGSHSHALGIVVEYANPNFKEYF